ncbi:MAG: NADH-quinone oxidoreductase subunit NuoK [Francisellaceae bacterium]|jgi:NADH-quinone oxidoreductase subunit K|nr:NADH-quinone oxidoreductase subunit NuoK [Francisellaceae bacterium]MBT6207291.1 NADH-quinone oxidoreductase subunit NuoK [Francisellaceae bacterium]MBT6539600.1 NADH-quinone oxidoreductase subunit NuoK [Francisellaceae bacterium]
MLLFYLTFSTLLFTIGITGIIINRKNIILILMCMELVLLAVNTNFIAFGNFLNDSHGQIFVFFILAVAAVEAAIGLAILVVLFNRRRTIDIDDLSTLKG